MNIKKEKKCTMNIKKKKCTSLGWQFLNDWLKYKM